MHSPRSSPFSCWLVLSLMGSVPLRASRLKSPPACRSLLSLVERLATPLAASHRASCKTQSPDHSRSEPPIPFVRNYDHARSLPDAPARHDRNPAHAFLVLRISLRGKGRDVPARLKN